MGAYAQPRKEYAYGLRSMSISTLGHRFCNRDCWADGPKAHAMREWAINYPVTDQPNRGRLERGAELAARKDLFI